MGKKEEEKKLPNPTDDCGKDVFHTNWWWTNRIFFCSLSLFKSSGRCRSSFTTLKKLPFFYPISFFLFRFFSHSHWTNVDGRKSRLTQKYIHIVQCRSSITYTSTFVSFLCGTVFFLFPSPTKEKQPKGQKAKLFFPSSFSFFYP